MNAVSHYPTVLPNDYWCNHVSYTMCSFTSAPSWLLCPSDCVCVFVWLMASLFLSYPFAKHHVNFFSPYFSPKGAVQLLDLLNILAVKRTFLHEIFRIILRSLLTSLFLNTGFHFSLPILGYERRKWGGRCSVLRNFYLALRVFIKHLHWIKMWCVSTGWVAHQKPSLCLCLYCLIDNVV